MWPSREVDTMRTPTTAEVGHGSRQEEIVSCIGSPRRAVFMRFTQLAIVTVFVGGAATGYGGQYDAFRSRAGAQP
jgi:hypothetical protein